MLLQPQKAEDQVELLHPGSDEPKLHMSLLPIAISDQELSPTEAVGWQIVPINGTDIRWWDPSILEIQLLSPELSYKIVVST